MDRWQIGIGSPAHRGIPPIELEIGSLSYSAVGLWVGYPSLLMQVSADMLSILSWTVMFLFLAKYFTGR